MSMLETANLLVYIDELETMQDDEYATWIKREELAAEAEAKYQVLMRQRAMLEKDSGTPITFISAFIRGDEDIAQARKQRDIAEALCEISKSKVTDIRLRIKVAEAQAQREWAEREHNVPVSAPWAE